MNRLNHPKAPSASIARMLVAAVVAVVVASPGRANTSADPIALEQWSAYMVQNPPQEAGCHRASYPSYVWQKVDCEVKPLRVHPTPRTR
jgi:hypothetical protein